MATIAVKQKIFPITGLSSDYQLVIVAGITLVVCLTVTYLTPAPSPTLIKAFQSKTSPIGFWPSTKKISLQSREHIKDILLALGASMVYSLALDIALCFIGLQEVFS